MAPLLGHKAKTVQPAAQPAMAANESTHALANEEVPAAVPEVTHETAVEEA